MRWEELTSDRFAQAVEECGGVCLVALSVVERHGHHLPVGTDTFQGRAVLSRVEAQEPVIVFPDYIFTQIPEARHLPGTISIDGDLMVKLLDNVCREIARNGCKKVVLINAHGGNFGLLAYYNMLQLYKPKDYVVYIVNPIGAAMRGEVQLPWDRSVDGHAGPGETSMMLSIRPDLVHMDRIVAGEGQSLQRLDALREAGVQTGIWWYADYPTHYAGDATYATAAAGEQILDATAAAVVQAVRAIKADDVAKRLQDDFYTGSQAPRLPGQ